MKYFDEINEVEVGEVVAATVYEVPYRGAFEMAAPISRVGFPRKNLDEPRVSKRLFTEIGSGEGGRRLWRRDA